MAEQDILGKFMSQYGGTMSRLRKQMKSSMPYGPLREGLTQREERGRMQDMDVDSKQQLAESMGPEKWAELMRELYK